MVSKISIRGCVKGDQGSCTFTSRGGAVGSAKRLVEYSTDISAKDNDGQTASHSAVQREHGEIIELLVLQADAEVDLKHNWRRTPLTTAIWKLSSFWLRKLALTSSRRTATTDRRRRPSRPRTAIWKQSSFWSRKPALMSSRRTGYSDRRR